MIKSLKKFLFLILLTCVVNTVSAKTFNVELITNENQITNGSGDSYIFTTTSSNETYAWINGIMDSSTMYQIKNNASLITINDDKTITIDDKYSKSALWSFSVSEKSVSNDKNAYTLVSRYYVNKDNIDKIQISFDFTKKDKTKHPTAFTYTDNAYPIHLEYKDGSVVTKISQSVNDKQYWVQFSSTDKNFYVSDKETSSKSFKIYKVIENTNQIQKYKTDEVGDINFSKNQTKHESFIKTGVYKIDLLLNAKTIMKDSDVLLVLDYSNSMDFETKKKQLDEVTTKLSETLLKLNPNNRIGVVKFAKDIIYEEDSLNLGLSSDINKIKELISKNLDSVPGGTNYTYAFETAKQILNENYKPNRDQIIVFVSDGAPTIYNQAKYSVFSKTNDGKVGEYASNWYEYLSKYDLKQVIDLKAQGVEIMSIGVGTNQEMAMQTDGSYVVKPEWVQSILKRISSSPEKTYFVDDSTEIEDIFKDTSFLKMFIKNIYVNDSIKDNYHLVIDDFETYKPYIEIKLGNGEVIEKITFDENGKAYSTLSGNKNIITEKNSSKILDANNFTYNFDTQKIVWKIDRLTEEDIILTYFIEPNDVKDKYDEDESATNGTVDVTYEDYNGNEKENSYTRQIENTEKLPDNQNNESNQNNQNEEKNEEIINPPTGTYLPYTCMIVLLIAGISVILYTKKYKYFK